jgi:hypothetical protein
MTASIAYVNLPAAGKISKKLQRGNFACLLVLCENIFRNLTKLNQKTLIKCK